MSHNETQRGVQRHTSTRLALNDSWQQTPAPHSSSDRHYHHQRRRRCRHHCHRYLLLKPFNRHIKTAETNGPLYSNTVIGTLAVDGWAVTARRCVPGWAGAHPVPSSLYQMKHPTNQRPVYQLHLICCGTIINRKLSTENKIWPPRCRGAGRGNGNDVCRRRCDDERSWHWQHSDRARPAAAATAATAQAGRWQYSHQWRNASVDCHQSHRTAEVSRLVVSAATLLRVCLSCRREAARCFVSLNISLSYSRSFKVIRNGTLSKACVGPCWHFIVTMSLSGTVSEIFKVK